MEFLKKPLEELISTMMIESFFRALLVAVFTLMGTYLVYLVRKKIPSRLAWGLKDPKKAVFVLATSASIDTGHYIRHTTGFGQVRAMCWLIPSFEKAFGFFDNDNVFFSETVPENALKNDLVILGGTKNNKIARNIIKLLGNLPYTQEVRDGIDCILDNRKNVIFTGAAFDGKITEDYGLIVRCPNPRNPSRTCLIFLSIHTQGMDSAAAAFVEKLSFSQYALGQSYVCLVKSRVNGNAVDAPTIVDYIKLRFCDNNTYWVSKL